MIVVDASVVVNAVADDERDGDLARDRIARESDLHSPHILDLEVLSALRKQTAARVLDEDRAAMAIEDLRSLGVVRHPHGVLLSRIWELRGNATPYDAAYLALAETLGCAFLTSDVALSKVRPVRCPIEVLL
ncbi:MAG: type II toxin-antitoxin system VapC family toxin [Actinomycetota bacterium]